MFVEEVVVWLCVGWYLDENNLIVGGMFVVGKDDEVIGGSDVLKGWGEGIVG